MTGRDKARIWLIGAACAAAAVLALLALPGGHAAAGSQRAAAVQPGQPCPPGQAAANCIRGTVIIWEDPAHEALNQFVQEDKSGAPQFSIAVGGTASWANPFCVTNNPLTDHGRLMFPACFGGAWANGQGRPVIILTANDGVTPTIILVQGGQRATLDFAQLLALDRWLAVRGVR